MQQQNKDLNLDHGSKQNIRYKNERRTIKLMRMVSKGISNSPIIELNEMDESQDNTFFK